MSCSNTITCAGGSSPWASYGLPPPNVSGFGYSIDAGVVRTVFDSGVVRQRRRRPRGRRVYPLAWTLDLASLQTLELFIAAYGHAWFTLPTPAGDLTLRIIGPLAVRAAGYDRVSASCEAESAGA